MQIKKNETFYTPFEENRLAFNVDPLKPSNHIKYSELSKFDLEESSSAKEGKAVRLGRQNIYFINTINLYTGQKKLSYDKLFTAMREFHSQSLKEKKTNVTVSGVTKNPSPMMLLKKAIFKSNRFYLDKKEIRLFNLIDFSYSNSDIISKIQWFLLNGPSTISGSTDPKELENYLIPASIIFCPKIYAFEEKAENTIHKIMKEGKGVGSTGLDVLYSLSYENEIQYELVSSLSEGNKIEIKKLQGWLKNYIPILREHHKDIDQNILENLKIDFLLTSDALLKNNLYEEKINFLLSNCSKLGCQSSERRLLRTVEF